MPTNPIAPVSQDEVKAANETERLAETLRKRADRVLFESQASTPT